MSQVVSSHYFRNYDTKGRFCSYWHQIDEIISHKPKRILEIGLGNGLVSNYIRRMDYYLLTIDIDKNLSPDITASVLKLPFIDKFFEVVACYQVLEHLPYDFFEKILSELRRVSSCYVFISLPDVNSFYPFYIQVPRIILLKKIFTFSWFNKKPHHFDGQHYWEIGKAGYTLDYITDTISKAGFIIEKTYRVFENPYHRFFILKRL